MKDEDHPPLWPIDREAIAWILGPAFTWAGRQPSDRDIAVAGRAFVIAAYFARWEYPQELARPSGAEASKRLQRLQQAVGVVLDRIKELDRPVQGERFRHHVRNLLGTVLLAGRGDPDAIRMMQRPEPAEYEPGADGVWLYDHAADALDDMILAMRDVREAAASAATEPLGRGARGVWPLVRGSERSANAREEAVRKLLWVLNDRLGELPPEHRDRIDREDGPLVTPCVRFLQWLAQHGGPPAISPRSCERMLETRIHHPPRRIAPKH